MARIPIDEPASQQLQSQPLRRSDQDHSGESLISEDVDPPDVAAHV
jgi:hypothetical protein